MRASSSAIMIFMLNFVGLVFGAMILGAMSDILNHGAGLGEVEGIRWAMILTVAVSVVAIPLFWTAGNTIAQDIES
jgi:MFS family permease